MTDATSTTGPIHLTVDGVLQHMTAAARSAAAGLAGAA
jgi:hypothetical protein